jgi:hypothetical protein
LARCQTATFLWADNCLSAGALAEPVGINVWAPQE